MRSQTFQTVSVHDPAIDTARMTPDELLEFARTRDMSLLKFQPGNPPTVFHCREVPHRLWTTYVMGSDNPGDAEIARRCFLAGVTKVCDVYSRDDVRIEKLELARENRLDIVQEEELERFSPSEVLEIGTCIFWHSFLPPRTEPTYRLPHLSHTTLIVREFRPAAASPDEQGQSSEQVCYATGSVQPASPTTASASPGAASGSADPTDATAQETG